MLDKIDELLKEVQGFTSTNKDEIRTISYQIQWEKGILNDFSKNLKKFRMNRKRIWSKNQYTQTSRKY